MNRQRMVSAWFPHLPAERMMRQFGDTSELPLVVVIRKSGAQLVLSASSSAQAFGARDGLPLQDALAICADLVVRSADEAADAAFLSRLRKISERFAPRVAEDGRRGLILDVTGCTRLFGGEAGLLTAMVEGFAALGLTCRVAMADTIGGAWALARFNSSSDDRFGGGGRIDHQTRATRSRAANSRIRPAPSMTTGPCIVPPGELREHLAPLPVDALRLPADTAEKMKAIGLRRIADLAQLPRAPLARRFGVDSLRRLDQALGRSSETIHPTPLPRRFRARLTLPEPIALHDDVMAAIDRLLSRLCSKLCDAHRGARHIRLEFQRVDGQPIGLEIGLARPTGNPDSIRSLILLKLAGIDAGFGIDRIRIEASQTEPDQAGEAQGLSGLIDTPQAQPNDLAELISRIGLRVGLEAVTRLHPADSHIPEKSHTVMAAAWCEPASSWPPPKRRRPVLLLGPEPVEARTRPSPPSIFRWRRQDFQRASAEGPERIAPEWWLDDPNWRSGTRDYWRIETRCGRRLWLFFAHGTNHCRAGWFCHGDFG